MSAIKLDEPKIHFFSQLCRECMCSCKTPLEHFQGYFSMATPEELSTKECRIQHKCITSTADSSSWTLIQNQKSWQSVSAEHKERWISHLIAQISSLTGQKPSTQQVLQSIQSPLKRIIEWKLHYTNRHLREDSNLA